MKSQQLRKVTKLRVTGSRSSEDGHTLFRIQASFQVHESTIFEARFSSMLALHKCLIQMNKKELFPAFPSRHVFRPANEELVLLRRKELDNYLIELMNVRPFGGMATLIEFIDYQGIVEVCKQLQVSTKQELKKLYAKQGVVGSTFSGSAKLRTRDAISYVLKSEKLLTKKYFLDNEYDDYIEKLRRLPKHSNFQQPEQFFMEKRSTNDQGQQQIAVYTLTRFFEQTLESEIVKRFQQKRTFKTKEIIECLRQVFKGLNVLYSNGIYHKNLKPSNIGIRVGKRDTDNRNNPQKEEINGNGNKKMNNTNGGIKVDIRKEQEEASQKNIKINGVGTSTSSSNGDNKNSNGPTTSSNPPDQSGNNSNNIKNDINKNNSIKVIANGSNNPASNSNVNTASSSNSLESTSTVGNQQNNVNSNSNNNQQQQNQYKEQIQYVLFDFDELLHRYKLNKMKEGDIERDRYCINISYLSENKLAVLRNTNVLTTYSYSNSNSNNSNATNGSSLSKNFQINSNNQISGSQQQNDDMYSLGVSMLQAARCMSRSELQGFQGLSLRQDLVRNYLQDVLITHGSELFYYIHLLLGKGQQVDACYYGYSSDKQQERTNSQDFSGEGSSEQQSIFDMIFKLLLPDEVNHTARIQLSKTSQLETVKQLEYADECLIIKNRNNEDDNQDNNSKNDNNNTNATTTDEKSIVNRYQQQPTQHVLRILLRDSHLSDNQVRALVENSITSLSAFRSYVGVDLSGSAITDESGVFLSELVCNLINIDSISFDFSMLQGITIQLPLLIILALNKNSNIKELLIDLSGCTNITAECIVQIISAAKSISSLLQFSLYFFNSKISKEQLGLIYSEQVENISSEVSHDHSCASIKFIYSF